MRPWEVNAVTKRVFTAEEQKGRVKAYTDDGLTIREANRVVYGWSEPAMGKIWDEAWKGRDPQSPQLEQKEAFYLILKTSFGKDYSPTAQLFLKDEQIREICRALVNGIQAGCVYRRSNTKRPPTIQNLMQTARSELNRFIDEDPRVQNIIVHDED